MTDEDDSPGLRNLHATIDDGVENLTAFLSPAAGAEVPHELLVNAARQVVLDLGAWREKLGEVVGRGGRGEGVH